MIRVRDVHKTYVTGGLRNEVLRGVDLDISEDDYVAIVGRSGSGKTTLLNVIGGLDGDYRGTVEIDGVALQQMSDRKLSEYRNQNVGFIFQSFHLLDHMTCVENVTLPALFAREGEKSQAALSERAREVLEMVGVPDKASALPRHLSGGQKQRVAIARALFNRPRVLICDEPTGNLDRATGDSILELFERLNDDGITLLIVTHDPAISARAKRTVRIVDGKVAHEPAPAADSESQTEPERSRNEVAG